MGAESFVIRHITVNLFAGFGGQWFDSARVEAPVTAIWLAAVPTQQSETKTELIDKPII